MANYYTLSFSSIALAAVGIAISPAKATALVAGDIKIEKWDGSAFVAFTDFTVTGAGVSAATIDPTTDFAQTDLLLIQIDDGTNKSDRLMLDFSQAYTGHKADYKFELPAQTGAYKFTLGKVNGTDFSSVASSPI